MVIFKIVSEFYELSYCLFSPLYDSKYLSSNSLSDTVQCFANKEYENFIVQTMKWFFFFLRIQTKEVCLICHSSSIGSIDCIHSYGK